MTKDTPNGDVPLTSERLAEQYADQWLARHSLTRETFEAAVLEGLDRGRGLVAWPMEDADGLPSMFQPWWRDTHDFLPSALVTDLFRRGLIAWRDETPSGWADIRRMPAIVPVP